jgi:broad specificity phosphatase PhoE
VQLLLIRHGQTSLHEREILAGWTNDPGLDLAGKQQVKKLAKHIRKFFPQRHFSAIYTSPLPRAKQTAEIFSTILSIPLFVEDNLKDINIGDWAGQSFAEVVNSDLGKRYFLDPVGVRLPNGEEIVEVLDRVIPVTERILMHSKNRSAIIIAHLDVIKLILAYYTEYSLHDLHRLEMIPVASGRLISFSKDVVQVMPINAAL